MHRFGRGGPRWGAHDAPPDPLVGWGGGYPFPTPFPSPLDAFGVSNSAPYGASVLKPPSAQNPGYASAFEDSSCTKFQTFPTEGAYSYLPDPLDGEEGHSLAAPTPRTPVPALDPLGIGLRPFGQKLRPLSMRDKISPPQK